MIFFKQRLNKYKEYFRINKHVPKHIVLLGLKYPTTDYQKEYNCPYTINLSRGEIYKQQRSKLTEIPVGGRCVGQYWEDNIEFDVIWVHLGDNWFKFISKVKSSPWSCQ